MNAEKFLKQIDVNPDEKIDNGSDGYWKLKDILEHYTEQLILHNVSNSAYNDAEMIEALNNTLLANKAVGNYETLEESCIGKLRKLVNKI